MSEQPTNESAQAARIPVIPECDPEWEAEKQACHRYVERVIRQNMRKRAARGITRPEPTTAKNIFRKLEAAAHTLDTTLRYASEVPNCYMNTHDVLTMHETLALVSDTIQEIRKLQEPLRMAIAKLDVHTRQITP